MRKEIGRKNGETERKRQRKTQIERRDKGVEGREREQSEVERDKRQS